MATERILDKERDLLDAAPPLLAAERRRRIAEAASLLRSAHGDERRQGSLHIPERRLRTRAHSACTKKVALPLIGVGVHAVRDAGRLQRIQLHLLTDEAALSLVPWPMRRR